LLSRIPTGVRVDPWKVLPGSDVTYYHWKVKYEGNQSGRLRQVENENGRRTRQRGTEETG